jgi:REP element-mobilizing transposase RayT
MLTFKSQTKYTRDNLCFFLTLIMCKRDKALNKTNFNRAEIKLNIIFAQLRI